MSDPAKKPKWTYWKQDEVVRASWGIGLSPDVVPYARVVGDDELNEATAKKIVDALNLEDVENENVQLKSRLDYIHAIICEKSNEGRDLELGSTAFKSVQRWSNWRDFPYTPPI